MEILLWIVTVGGIGYLPLSPFLAIVLGMLWMHFLQQKSSYWKWILVIQIAIAIILITLAPSQATDDPSIFVLDEFVAAGIILLVSRRWFLRILGLTTFLILDITKPVARHFEYLPGGLGIVGDDIISALLASLCLALLRYIIAYYKKTNKTKK